MRYKAIVIDCTHKVKKVAAAVESTANEYALVGWETVGFAPCSAGKAVLLLRAPEMCADDAPAVSEGETAQPVGDAE